MRTFNRQAARIVSNLVYDAAIDALKSEGVTVKKNTARYDAATCKITLTIVLPEASQKATESAMARSGLNIKIGDTFNFPTPTGRRRMYRIVDFVPNRRKYPVLAQNIRTGTKLKFATATVQRYMDRY